MLYFRPQVWPKAWTRWSAAALLAEYGEFGLSGVCSVNLPCGAERAVDLVRGDLEEPLHFLVPGGFQQVQRAGDIRLDEDSSGR